MQEIAKSTKRQKIDADTIISTVLDMSGSMSGIALSTMSGYNEYIGTQKDADNDTGNAGKAVASLTVFNSHWGRNGNDGINIQTLYHGLELDRVEELSLKQYVPNGGTPLYDTIVHVIMETDKLVENCKGTPDVFLVIITDGHENTSKEHTRDDVSRLISTRQEDGWNFVFLGADQDAWAVGTGLGIHGGNTYTYAKANIQEDVFGNVARGTTVHRAASHSLKSRGLIAKGDRYVTTAYFDTPNVEPVDTDLSVSSAEKDVTSSNRSQEDTK